MKGSLTSFLLRLEEEGEREGGREGKNPEASIYSHSIFCWHINTQGGKVCAHHPELAVLLDRLAQVTTSSSLPSFFIPYILSSPSRPPSLPSSFPP